MARQAERAEVKLPFGEVIYTSGKNLKSLQLLIDNPLLSRGDLAEQVWEREINHPNPFQRMTLDEILSQNSYLVSRLRMVKDLLPTRYKIGTLDNGYTGNQISDTMLRYIFVWKRVSKDSIVRSLNILVTRFRTLC